MSARAASACCDRPDRVTPTAFGLRRGLIADDLPSSCEVQERRDILYREERTPSAPLRPGSVAGVHGCVAGPRPLFFFCCPRNARFGIDRPRDYLARGVSRISELGRLVHDRRGGDDAGPYAVRTPQPTVRAARTGRTSKLEMEGGGVRGWGCVIADFGLRALGIFEPAAYPSSASARACDRPSAHVRFARREPRPLPRNRGNIIPGEATLIRVSEMEGRFGASSQEGRRSCSAGVRGDAITIAGRYGVSFFSDELIVHCSDALGTQFLLTALSSAARTTSSRSYEFVCFVLDGGCTTIVCAGRSVTRSASASRRGPGVIGYLVHGGSSPGHRPAATPLRRAPGFHSSSSFA